MRYAHIAQRAFNTPLLVEPRKATAFLRGLGPRLLGAPVRELAFEAGDGAPPAAAAPFATLLGDELGASIRRGERRGYPVVEGVAIVPVSGVLVHRGAYLGESSGETSYEGLRAQIDSAAADPTVRAIALEIDSFGGEVAGCFDLADAVRAAREVKPVRAFVAEHAYSAAYAIAAQAERIVVPRSGGVGSIGVVWMHVDMSRALDAAGVTVTLVHAGRHKVDGNQFEPLGEETHDDLRAEMEELRRLFARTVGEGRGARLSATAALATEARCLRAGAAVEAGLADEIAEPRAAFAAWVAELTESAASARNAGGPRMAKLLSKAALAAEKEHEDEDAAAAAAAAEEEEEARRAAADAEEDEGGEDDAAEDEDEQEASAAGERRRIGAILGSPEAAGRESLARHLAIETGLSPKAAIAALKAAPKAAGGRLGAALAGAELRTAVPSQAAPRGGSAEQWGAGVFSRAGIKMKGA